MNPLSFLSQLVHNAQTNFGLNQHTTQTKQANPIGQPLPQLSQALPSPLAPNQGLGQYTDHAVRFGIPSFYAKPSQYTVQQPNVTNLPISSVGDRNTGMQYIYNTQTHLPFSQPQQLPDHATIPLQYQNTNAVLTTPALLRNITGTYQSRA